MDFLVIIVCLLAIISSIGLGRAQGCAAYTLPVDKVVDHEIGLAISGVLMWIMEFALLNFTTQPQLEQAVGLLLLTVVAWSSGRLLGQSRGKFNNLEFRRKMRQEKRKSRRAEKRERAAAAARRASTQTKTYVDRCNRLRRTLEVHMQEAADITGIPGDTWEPLGRYLDVILGKGGTDGTIVHPLHMLERVGRDLDELNAFDDLLTGGQTVLTNGDRSVTDLLKIEDETTNQLVRFERFLAQIDDDMRCVNRWYEQDPRSQKAARRREEIMQMLRSIVTDLWHGMEDALEHADKENSFDTLEAELRAMRADIMTLEVSDPDLHAVTSPELTPAQRPKKAGQGLA